VPIAGKRGILSVVYMMISCHAVGWSQFARHVSAAVGFVRGLLSERRTFVMMRCSGATVVISDNKNAREAILVQAAESAANDTASGCDTCTCQCTSPSDWRSSYWVASWPETRKHACGVIDSAAATSPS